MSNFYQYPPQQPSSSSGPYGGGNPNAYPYGQPAGNNYAANNNQQPNNFPPKFPGEELLGLQNVSPDVLKFGLATGQNMLKQQTDRFMPGFSNFWLSLKYYFSVSNSYVLKKLLLILYPISNKVWNRLSSDEFDRGEVSPSPQAQSDPGVVKGKWALPKNDINAPDLYIPLMSFITYVLLYGFLKGVNSPSSSAFSPDILTQAIWRCLMLQLIEAGGLKLGANILSIHVPFLDCYSFAGYKYVGLCVNTIARFVHGAFSVVISLYTSCMLAYFVLKTVAIAIPPSPNESSSGTASASPRLLIILGFGVAQLVLSLFMSLF